VINNPKVIGIIPARGGSKGIPRKNVLTLAGKPLIAWTIEAAREARLVDFVIVSTDDDEIARIAEDFGAHVVRRPSEISGDLASSEAALLHAIEHAFPNVGSRPEIVVFLQCTSPLTVSEDIDCTISALIESDADTALAVCDFHYFLWESNESGDFIGINHDKSVRLMRQERTAQFRETGAVYAMRTEGFLKHKHRFFGKTACHVIPAERVLEIDEPSDFRLAEYLMRARQKSKDSFHTLPLRPELVVFDFDGVMTDNCVYISEHGVESVRCDRGDGMGIELLRKAGIPMLILSKEVNPVVKVRAEKLRLPVMYGIEDKLSALQLHLQQNSIAPENVVYVGNDVNDLECLDFVGTPVIVADAHPDVISAGRLQLRSAGGRGAIRELADLILSKLNTRGILK
jgi:N-acylneuraminate cytidylyltransferase